MEICMIPPAFVSITSYGAVKSFSLRLQNIGELFFMDEQDWEKAKHCLWWWGDDNRVINGRDIYFEDYVGIKAERRTTDVEKYNFTRSSYGRD